MPHLWFANSSPFQAIGHTCLHFNRPLWPHWTVGASVFNYQIADVINLNCLLKKISMNTITYQTTLSRPFCFACFSKDKRGSLRTFMISKMYILFFLFEIMRVNVTFFFLKKKCDMWDLKRFMSKTQVVFNLN